MGSPIRFLHPVLSRRSRCAGGLSILSLVLCLFPEAGFSEPSGDGPGGRPGLPPGPWPHLIVTDASLADALRPLVQHRCERGLPSRIVTLAEASAWTGREDPREAVRDLVARASADRETRYVLLAGDSGIIPVPLGRWSYFGVSWEIPLDLYYAAPGGEWDRDGDGYPGEWMQDAAEPIPAVALGRAPVATPAEAAAFVAKVIDFETGVVRSADMLLVAAVGAPDPWFRGQHVLLDLAQYLEPVAGILAGWGGVDGFQGMYQYADGHVGSSALTSENLVAALRSGRYRYFDLLVHADDDAWRFGWDRISPGQAPVLAGSGHPLFGAALTAGSIDCRREGMLEALLAVPDGGIAGGVGISGVVYAPGIERLHDWYWEAVAAGQTRAGDAWRHCLTAHAGTIATAPGSWLAALSFGVVGDPALELEPPRPAVGPSQPRAELAADAHPNPFNPLTRISFVVPADSAASGATTVDIFSLAGRRVAGLMDRELAAGPHEVLWSGVDEGGCPVGSGVYFARIRSGGLSQTLKLVLLQ